MRGVMSEVRRSAMWMTPDLGKRRDRRTSVSALRRTAGLQDTSHLAHRPYRRRRSPRRRRIAPPRPPRRRPRRVGARSRPGRRPRAATRRRRCSSRDGGLTNTSSAVGKRLPDRQRALDVDLEQHVLARRQVLLHRRPRRAVRVAEDLERTRGSRPARAALRTPPGRRTGSRRRRPRRAAAHASWPTPKPDDGSRSRSLRTTVPLPTPDGPAITSRTARSGPAHDLRVAEQAFALVAAEPAEPTTLADVELRHDPARLHLADAGQRLEHAHDLELRERVVARRPGRRGLRDRASPA